MSWWLPHNFENKKKHLKKRMNLLRAVRNFFDNQGFLEVETPILQVSSVMDTHVHAFKTEIVGVDLVHERDIYLHTSPEFAMKKLLVAGLPQIYQICHVFRNAESSRLHSPEFTMIEWYRAQSDYRDIMDDCVELLRHIASTLDIQYYQYREHKADPFPRWNFISVTEAFEKYSKIDLEEHLDSTESFSAAIAEQGVRVAEGDHWDDLFFRVMAEKIEPRLGMGVPTILYDYPVSMASLSRKKPDDPRFAERFELYICGIELANAFSELTDATEQRARFEEEMTKKQALYGEQYPIDEDFLKALEHGLPESGGIALGLDRLAMLISGVDDIEKVLWAGRV